MLKLQLCTCTRFTGCLRPSWRALDRTLQCRRGEQPRSTGFCLSRSVRSAAVAEDSATEVASSSAASSSGPTPDKPSFTARLDFQSIKANQAYHERNCKVRRSDANPARIVELYDEYLDRQKAVQQLQTARNENSKAMKGKLEPDRRAELVERGKQLKEELAALEQQLEAVEWQLQREGQRLPNTTHPDVPEGDEEAAAELRVVGKAREFEFPIRDHLALGEVLDVIDFDAGSVVSGSKFYYLKRGAALLELALVSWAMQRAAGAGFLPCTTPDLVRATVLEKCGFQPRADNTQVYSISDSPLCLTGTAEVPLTALHMDQILAEEQLPMRLAAFGHCFRTEAGAPGAASRGLYRVHQFSKVELVVLCTPQQSEAALAELAGLEEAMFSELGLHYRVLDIASADLGAPANRKFDVEAWMPGLGRFGEISSASNCTDYQSRRLNIRYRPKAPEDASEPQPALGGKKAKKPAKAPPTEFVHTLNATACAVPRMVVAILENFQQADGSVVVPEVLRPFMGGMEVIAPPQK